MTSPAPRPSAGARGQGTYVSRACSVCRHKKIKCDGGKPRCQTCTNNGRESECTYGNVASRRTRTEAHFQALHQKDESRKQHIRRLESLLDQCQKEHPGSTAGSYLQLRPADWDESPTSYSPDEAWSEFPEDEEQDGGGVADELCLPVRSLSLGEEGGLLLHGAAAPLRYISERPQSATGRLIAISDNPDECYTLQIDGVDMVNFNPNFDWSRHLPSEVNLTRRQHDKILYDVFRFVTGWCLRIIPRLFLRDMCRALNVPKGQTPPHQSHYSPMLHNAILALGTAFSDVPAIRDLRSRTYFLEKARSYIEEEFPRPQLSVVQALSLIASFYSSQGDRTLGYMYFGNSGRACQTLGLSVDCSSWVERGYITAEEQVDRNWVYWSTFCQDVLWSLGVGRDFCIPGVPTIDIPFTDADFDNMDWVYHATGKQPRTGYEVTTFRELCRLMVIAKRIMPVVNTLDCLRNPQRVLEINNIDVALHQWNDDLPEELKDTARMRSNPTPNLLQLHLTSEWCFVLLHRPFCRRRSRAALMRENVIDHLKICKQAADRIMGLMATWREHFTLRYAPTRLIRPLFAAATIYIFLACQAMKGMRPAKKELQYAKRNTSLCIKYLKEIGETWFCATKMANIVKKMFHRINPETSEHTAISPAPSGILPHEEQEPEHARTDGAGDRKRKRPNSISGRRHGPSSVDDNSQGSSNSNSQLRIVSGILPTPIPSSEAAVHTPVQNLPPAQMPHIPTPPASQFATHQSFQDRSSLPLPPQYFPMQPAQLMHTPPPPLWTGSRVMPSVELPAVPTLTLSQQSHAQHPFNTDRMDTFQHTFVGDQTSSQSALFSIAPPTSAVHTNGNTAGGSARPIGPMSRLFAISNGQGLGEIPFVPSGAELGEDPMTAFDPYGFEFLQSWEGEEMGVDLMDMELGEQELSEGPDAAEYPDLYGE